MPKPGTKPNWNTDGSNRVTPSAGIQTTGWVNGDVPPSSYLNWWQNLVYQWTVWLDGLQGEILTWTGLQTFTGGSVFTGPTGQPGASFNGGGGAGNAASTFQGTGTSPGATATGGANNAGFTGTGGTGNANGLEGIPTGNKAGIKANAGSTYDAVDSQGYIDLSSSHQPLVGDAIANRVTPNNVVKAWVVVNNANDVVTSNLALTPTAGFNIFSVAQNSGGVTSVIRVTFGQTISAGFGIAVGYENSDPGIYVPVISARGVTGGRTYVDVKLYDTTGTAIAWAVNSHIHTLNLMVIGAQ